MLAIKSQKYGELQTNFNKKVITKCNSIRLLTTENGLNKWSTNHSSKFWYFSLICDIFFALFLPGWLAFPWDLFGLGEGVDFGIDIYLTALQIIWHW